MLHWLDALAATSDDGEDGRFSAGVSGLFKELPLKMVAWTLYGEALTDEVRLSVSSTTRVWYLPSSALPCFLS